MTYRLIQGSAHSLPQIADASVQLVATSPPYFGLRAYSGDQDVEWQTIEYSPMPGLPPLRIQGCEPGCEHVWKDGRTITQQPQRDHDANGNFGNSRGNEASRQGMAFKTTQGRYCLHCKGWRGPLGLEPTIEAYIGHLILCLREWRRVLHPTGLCWVNLGDSYNGSGGAHAPDHANPGISKSAARNGHERPTRANGLKAKDLMMIPARFALAAQADGWWLRSAIVWAKGVSFLPDYAGSCMPESVQDRPTQSYEMVYMLAKSPDYFYDAQAVREPSLNVKWPTVGIDSHLARRQVINGGDIIKGEMNSDTNGRNLRSVWCINPQPYSSKISKTVRQRHDPSDDVSGDTKCIVSLDCPVHGDLARQDYRLLHGVRAIDLLSRNPGIDSRHAPKPTSGFVPTVQTPDGVTEGESLDYPGQLRFLSATDHNTESHRTGRAPATIQPYTLSAETDNRTDDKSASHELTAYDDHTQSSNNCADDSCEHPSVQTLSHRQDKFSYRIPPECTCEFYHEITEKPNHFACWPPALVEPMIKASTSERGCCSACGAPWRRVVELGEVQSVGGSPNNRRNGHTDFKGSDMNCGVFTQRAHITTGWQPTCACNAPIQPCTVLDPFCGSGTTLQVAVRLGRHAIGVDLSAEYLGELVPERMDTVSTEPIRITGGAEDWAASPLFAEVTA